MATASQCKLIQFHFYHPSQAQVGARQCENLPSAANRANLSVQSLNFSRGQREKLR